MVFGFMSKKKSKPAAPAAPARPAPAAPPRPSSRSLLRTQSEKVSVPPGFARSSTEFDAYMADGAGVPDGSKQMIDLVFAMDCTGSMGSYIDSARRSIAGIVDQVTTTENTDIRFGYCAYRDHPPQDSTFVTMCHPFTSDPAVMKKVIEAFGASGGGDGPEAVADALHEALHFPWRPAAVKIVVLIADAPPHGIGGSGDGFPNGCPDGHDPVKIANAMAEKGVVLYVVACEPSLSNFKNAHDIMEGLAQITEGRYLPLTAASLLPDVIVGGAREELALQKLEAMVDQEASRLEKDNIPQEQIEKRLAAMMEEAKVSTEQVQVTDIYGGYDTSNIENVKKCSGLQEAMAGMQSIRQPAMQMQEQRVTMCSAPPPAKKMMARRSKKASW